MKQRTPASNNSKAKPLADNRPSTVQLLAKPNNSLVNDLQPGTSGAPVPKQSIPGAAVYQRVTVKMAERTKHLGEVDSLKGHVMYARDKIIKTRKAGRRSTRAPRKAAGKISALERFYTHTEGHYVKTLNKKNLGARVHVEGTGKRKVMTHVLQGRLDMCKNCQAHLLPELRKKYPDYRHVVHYSFKNLDGARTLWARVKAKKLRKTVGTDALTRYNESS